MITKEDIKGFKCFVCGKQAEYFNNAYNKSLFFCSLKCSDKYWEKIDPISS